MQNKSKIQTDTNTAIEHITSFSPELAQDIRRLAKFVGNNYKELTDEDVREMITSSVTTILVAKSEGRIVGMITVVVYRIPYIRKAYLDDLVVDEAYRGQGIGTMLLEEAVTYAKEKGAAYVDFTARPRRAESNGLYEKMGFK